ncbi:MULTISPECIES: TnsA-like heteromeric transposase endonuclease subunit [Catellatospora]|uniref:TnsA-like heteromeric transposase endonuclease subunit n=1 Tax=Catellatospora TaxID=53365 RepID=UPI001182A864|nr:MULTISPECIES: TnsA-like heteromeric transposase endonuclease subunit [Catellatospora]
MTVDYRRPAGRTVEGQPWDTVPVAALIAALPWRTFRWHQGQRHYSGTYWSATQRDHVIYESRLELARLLFADFDRRVSAIVAQPFLLHAVVGGAHRRHVPDFLLVVDDRAVIVDVKPARRLVDATVAATLAWTAEVVALRGMRYEVWTEPPEVELANVRFLAGYRRAWLFDADLVARLSAADLDGATVSVAAGCAAGWPAPVARAAVLHLMWTGHLVFDMAVRLSGATVLRRPA